MPKQTSHVSQALHKALAELSKTATQDPDIPVDPPGVPLEADIGPGYIYTGN